MRHDTLENVTGTVLTEAHQALAADAITAYWCEQEATHGYLSWGAEPWVTGLRRADDPSSGFFVACGSYSNAVWIRSDVEPGLEDIDLLWGAPATAHEVVLSPSLKADLLCIGQLQTTSYRISLHDMLGSLRALLASPNAVPHAAPMETTQAPTQRQDDVWAEQLGELKLLAELTNDQIGTLFGVSRTSVQEWFAGRGMREGNREHLRQVLAILRDAHVRQGSSQRLHELLLAPFGDRQRRPFDYLREKQYTIARGYLHRRSNADRHRTRRPFNSSDRVSEADRQDNLEQLSPSPRAVWDDE